MTACLVAKSACQVASSRHLPSARRGRGLTAYLDGHAGEEFKWRPAAVPLPPPCADPAACPRTLMTTLETCRSEWLPTLMYEQKASPRWMELGGGGGRGEERSRREGVETGAGGRDCGGEERGREGDGWVGG